MGEEGARIYGTPGVHNNFPFLRRGFEAVSDLQSTL